jgi:MEDS: MEthanogen/methylotroph, DcmR Sensory domain
MPKVPGAAPSADGAARSHGTRFEVLRMRPHDHIAWIFTGADEFAALATQYLAEGARLGERVMCVQDKLGQHDLAELAGQVKPGALMVASVAEVYGESGIVDPAGQRAKYAAYVNDALEAGYSGLRVAADNTRLVANEDRLKAWIRWEFIADRFIAESQITAMCAFNKQKVDVNHLRHLATLHPMSSASCPLPQYRLFSDSQNLYIEGEVDSFAVTQISLALQSLTPHSGVIVDLASATMMSRAAVTGLSEVARDGVNITITGDRAAIEELRSFGASIDQLVLQEN